VIIVPSFCFEDGAGASRRSGRVKDAEGAAERGAEEPILSSVGDKPARFSALITLGKIGGAAHPWAGPIGAVRWEV
jgi:hypothetical protein